MPTILWDDPSSPLCSVPSALMAFGIVPVNQEHAVVNIRGCTLMDGDALEVIMQNFRQVPANVSGYPTQDENVYVTVSYNYQ